MKTIILFTCAIFLGITSTLAQNSLNLIVFSEGGEQFYLVVNGIRQNIEPETNVKVTDLTATSLSVKVVFADTKIASVTQNGGLFEFGKEYTLKIKAKKKGGYALRFFGEVPMTSGSTSSDMSVISYHSEPIVETTTSTSGTAGDVAISTGTDVSTTGTDISTSGSTGTTTTTTTHSTTTTTSGSGTGMNVGINDGETGTDVSVGMSVGESGISINISDNMMGGDMGTTTTGTGTSTTTTTTSTSVTTSGTTTGFDDVIVDEPVETVETVVYVDGYTGSIGCAVPQSSAASIKGAIEDEDFKSDKIMVAKQATKNKCLTVSQIIDISDAFDFEDNKLEFAKYAYDRTYDKDNYYQVNKIFDFASNKRELNEYISGK
jgi:hypothetical protein